MFISIRILIFNLYVSHIQTLGRYLHVYFTRLLPRPLIITSHDAHALVTV